MPDAPHYADEQGGLPELHLAQGANEVVAPTVFLAKGSDGIDGGASSQSADQSDQHHQIGRHLSHLLAHHLLLVFRHMVLVNQLLGVVFQRYTGHHAVDEDTKENQHHGQ